MRAALALGATLLLSACQPEPVGTGAVEQAGASSSSAPDMTPAMVARLAEQERVHAAACAADEKPIFACKFADGKRVAVCGTKTENAEYRFGGDQPELVLSGGERAYAMYSGGGESQLAFGNGDTRYIVFSRMVRTGFDENGNAPAISDGVVVERAGKFAGIRVCEDPDVLPVNLDAAEIYLPADQASGGQALFTDETIRADPFGNE